MAKKGLEMPKAPKNLWEQLDAVRETQHIHIVDDESLFTTAQYAERYNLPPRTAYDQVRKLVKTGVIELAFVRGRVPYYRVIE